MLEWFKINMPVAGTELNYTTPYQLMVSVILSAQCTDKRVNMVTPPFFDRFQNWEALAGSTTEEIFEYIKSVTYPNNKSKHLLNIAKAIINEHNGVVPSDTAELERLPGIGRKSANVIASVIYNIPVIAVDTHVFRVSRRIGLSTGKTPLAVELELTTYIPEEYRVLAHHWLILHGRYICTARTPKWEICGLSDVCLYYREKRV